MPVIPRYDPVIESQDDIADAQVVVAGAGKALQHRGPIVTDIAGETPLKGRELGDRSLLERQETAGYAQRITGYGTPEGIASITSFCPVSLATDHGDGIRGQE